MEEDIQNYLPTVKFRGTPCTFFTLKPVFRTMTPSPFSLLKSIYVHLLETDTGGNMHFLEKRESAPKWTGLPPL